MISSDTAASARPAHLTIRTPLPSIDTDLGMVFDSEARRWVLLGSLAPCEIRHFWHFAACAFCGEAAPLKGKFAARGWSDNRQRCAHWVSGSPCRTLAMPLSLFCEAHEYRPMPVPLVSVPAPVPARPRPARFLPLARRRAGALYRIEMAKRSGRGKHVTPHGWRYNVAWMTESENVASERIAERHEGERILWRQIRSSGRSNCLRQADVMRRSEASI